MERVIDSLDWNMPGKQAFLAFDHVGGEAMFFNAYAWIDDRTKEPWYRGLLLSELVDALEAAGVSVGQTTNFSLAKSRREADELRRVIAPALWSRFAAGRSEHVANRVGHAAVGSLRPRHENDR